MLCGVKKIIVEAISVSLHNWLLAVVRPAPGEVANSFTQDTRKRLSINNVDSCGSDLDVFAVRKLLTILFSFQV